MYQHSSSFIKLEAGKENVNSPIPVYVQLQGMVTLDFKIMVGLNQEYNLNILTIDVIE